MIINENSKKILDAFHALDDLTTTLNTAILQEKHLIAWTQNTDKLLFPCASTLPAREKAAAIYRQLHYLDQQAPREIIICAGFIGVSETTLNLGQQVNALKDTFKQCILSVKKSELSITLKSLNLSRLHLKQCYRKIPLLDQVPHKISWTWAHTRSIKKISTAQAHQLLLKKTMDAGIELQIKKLASLSPHEPLAIVQELAPHLRTNLVFQHHNQIYRKMIKGAVPILFMCNENTPFPDFSPPKEKQQKNLLRPTRSDVLLDPQVFLPAIRAHRYRSSLSQKAQIMTSDELFS